MQEANTKRIDAIQGSPHTRSCSPTDKEIQEETWGWEGIVGTEVFQTITDSPGIINIAPPKPRDIL